MQTSASDPGVLASLGWIDLTALAVLLVFFVLGLFRGFVWQASRIATLVTAFVVAGMYGEAVASKIRSWFAEGSPESLPLYVAYFCIFLVVLVLLSILAFFLEKLVQKTGLSFYNRTGGGLLGIGTGGCVILAMLWGILMFFPTESGIVEAAEGSRSMVVSKRALEMLGESVPEPVRDVFGVEPGEGGAGEGEGK